jgi:hypothetical protein
VTIIGGQLLCLLLTLLVTPIIYSYFDGLRTWRPSDLLEMLRIRKLRRNAATGTAPALDRPIASE